MQRKIKHFMSLIKGITLLNAPFRMSDDEKTLLPIKISTKPQNYGEWSVRACFMFARYAKEDFDSDDWERKRAAI